MQHHLNEIVIGLNGKCDRALFGKGWCHQFWKFLVHLVVVLPALHGQGLIDCPFLNLNTIRHWKRDRKHKQQTSGRKSENSLLKRFN